MELRVQGILIDCVQGDIANQPGFDAVVNAANAQLMPGGGVAGVIHRAAGPELAAECRALAPIRPGEAVITGAYRLPNQYVIHCLGPRYGKDMPSDELLAACYRNALRLAEEHHLRSIAFPAISTGAFAYPVEEAADVALQAIATALPSLRSVEHIRFVVVGRRSYQAHAEYLQRALG